MRLHKHLKDAYKNTAARDQKEGHPPRNQEAAAPKARTSSLAKTTVNSSDFLKFVSQTDPGQRPSLGEIAGFLLLIGKDEAAKILAHLPDDLIEKISLEISRIGVLRPEEGKKIIEHFHIAVTEEQKKLQGGRKFARELLEKSLGKEKAVNIISRILAPASIDQLDFLNELEPAQLRHLLSEEHPRLIGIILSHLEPQLGAKLLEILPNEIKPQIIHTMRERVRLSQETLESIVKSLKEKIRRIGTQQTEILDGAQILTEILRSMNADAERRLLEELGMRVPEIQTQIKERLFTIEQVQAIRDRDLQGILAEMTDENIALLMKGKDEEIRRRFLDNVSGERAILISETYHLMGPIPRREVLEATKKFIDRLRIMEERGEIIVYSDSDELVE